MHYIFIVNGRQDFEYVEGEVLEQLKGLSIQYTIYRTIGMGDATRFTKVYCDLHHHEEVCFVACGGSGICNEVASGIVGESNKSMAIIPFGATNDFLKNFPDRDFKSFRKVLGGEIKNVDILKVNDNYAINVCNFGFDSIVASEANYLTEIKKKHPYERGIIRAILGGRFNRIKVVVDGKPINRWMIFSCALANGKFVGGQFLCAPEADTSDGWMDVCLIKVMTLARFLWLFPHYVLGEHILPKYSRFVTYCKAKHVEISAKDLINVVLDGDLLPGTQFTVDLIPNAVRLMLPPIEEK